MGAVMIIDNMIHLEVGLFWFAIVAAALVGVVVGFAVAWDIRGRGM
jgi:hypothetical protein